MDGLSEAREMLGLWMAAERAITAGKSYTIGQRSLTRVDLSDIVSRINFWRSEVERLEAGRPAGIRVLRAVPRDF